MYYGNKIPECADEFLEAPDSPDGNYSKGKFNNDVILIAEDGEYKKFSGTRDECMHWIDENEQFYGEGQNLIID